MHTLNDFTADVVARAGAGDREAFGLIYDRLERPIYSYTYRMLGDAHDAYDITADAFVRLWGALPRATPDTSVSALTFRIATNLCLDLFRRRARLRWLPWDAAKHDHLRPAPEADDPAWSAETREAVAAVRAALARLCPRDRALLLLHDGEGLSCREVGEALGLSHSAVKSARHRAKERLRAAYGAAGPGRMEVVA